MSDTTISEDEQNLADLVEANDGSMRTLPAIPGESARVELHLGNMIISARGESEADAASKLVAAICEVFGVEVFTDLGED